MRLVWRAGVLLLVDSVEGPMPQTRFVLRKALELNKKVRPAQLGPALARWTTGLGAHIAAPAFAIHPTAVAVQPKRLRRGLGSSHERRQH